MNVHVEHAPARERVASREVIPGVSVPKALFVLAAAMLATEDARAAEVQGVHFVESLDERGEQLLLHNTGVVRHRYVAALYLTGSFGGELTPSGVLADLPRRIEIQYFWSIPAFVFRNATIAGIARNTDRATFSGLRDRIDQLNEMYEGVAPGDRYALTYLPGVGTALDRNGRRVGIVEGADFSAALFGIWLGDKAFDDSLREQLLALR